jgi:hypothetical protein
VPHSSGATASSAHLCRGRKRHGHLGAAHPGQRDAVAGNLSTSVFQEPRTIYSADGQPVGKVFLHALSHVTFRDANGNSVPDPGEITANVDRFFFTCH